MLSGPHEALVDLFRHRPRLAAELLAESLGVALPAYDRVAVAATDLPQLVPTEYRADAVVTLSARDTVVLAVVVEVQLSRDAGKRWSWPVYLSTLRSRLRCPTVLLVVCVDRSLARWCAAPILLGHPGWTLVPLVLGPDRVPLVTDTSAATGAPELAVLSALAHGAQHEKVIDALAGVLATLNEEQAALYADVVFAVLSATAPRHVEDLLATKLREYRSDFVRRLFDEGRDQGLDQGRDQGLAQGRDEGLAQGVALGRDEGRAEGEAIGEARALMRILETRGIDVPDDARDRITGCTDLDRLERWIERAVTAHAVDDLFV